MQYAKLVGYKVVAICSPHNYDLVKSYGADAAFDYHDGAKAGEEIRMYTGGGVTIGMDTISEGSSFEIALGGFNEDTPGRLECMLIHPKGYLDIRPRVKISTIFMYTFFGKAFTLTKGLHLPAIPENRKFGTVAYAKTPEIITTYDIKPNPLEIRGGLDDINAGLIDMSEGKVSGKKLIYKIAS